MELELLITKDFEEALKRYPHKNVVFKAIGQLLENPRHRGLQVHRLEQARDGIWIAYISDGNRIIYEFKDKILCLWRLGSHEIENVRSNSFASHTRFSRMEWSPYPATSVAVEAEQTPTKPLPVVRPYVVPNTPVQKGSSNHFAFFQDAHLRVLGVPVQLVQRLKAAPSLEAALDLEELPDRTRIWLMEISTSPAFKHIVYDSSLLLYRTTLDHLEGYCERKIKRLMLNLQRPEQQKYVDMEHAPLFVLRGVAGSGKTTVGAYRAIRLAKKGRRVLMLTFNPILAATTRSLIEELIEQEPIEPEIHFSVPANLEVMHVQELQRKLLAERMPAMVIKGEHECNVLLDEAIAEVQHKTHSQLFQRDRKFFQEELKYVIKGFGLKSLDEYRSVERYGRKTALGPAYRDVMWQVYEAYRRRFMKSQTIDYYDIAMQALESLHRQSARQRYDDIIVDEAQDLTIVDLRMIQQLLTIASANTGIPPTLMILADAAQTMYARGFSWKQAGIRARGHTAILWKNHRNTQQIAEAAAQLLTNNTLQRASGEYINPVWTNRQGPPPILIKATKLFHQIELVRDLIFDLVSSQTFRPSDFALLCPTESLCEMCMQELRTRGLRTMLHSDPQFDVLDDCIKIMTIQSAKGLEFPVVFLLGVTDGLLPSRQGMQHLEPEERNLFMEHQRSLCYIGMTRAAEILYILTTQNAESIFVKELEGKIRLWD